MLRWLLPLKIALLTCFLGAAADAQTVGGDWPTKLSLQSDFSGFGRAACRVEDLNADGIADFAIGVPYLSPFWGTEAGAVRFYSGADGSLLRSTYGITAFDHLGAAVAGLGDLNGDGIGDYLLGAPHCNVNGLLQAGSVFVRSGADDSLLFSFDGPCSHALFGQAVAAAGDVDGDTIDDLLIGAPGSSPSGKAQAGEAYLYSGATGALLARFEGNAAGDAFGCSVSAGGDVNQDGWPDLLVGAVTTDVNSRSNCGSAYVFSGRNGALLWRVNGVHNNDFLGSSVANCGDLNGDSFPDIVLGVPGADPDNKSFAGSVWAYSGADGSLLFRCDGLNPSDALGTVVANAGDVDGDSINDIIAGAPEAGLRAGYAAVFSGADGHLLQQRSADHLLGQLGYAVCGMGDLNFDGRAEVLVTSPYITPTALIDNFVYIYGFDPYLESDCSSLSAGLGGSVLFTIDFPNSVGNNSYKLLGTSHGTGSTTVGNIEIPLIASGQVWNALASTTPPGFFTNADGQLNSDGDAFASMQMPAGGASSFIDSDIHFCVLVYTPPASALVSSAAVALRILP